MIKSIVKESIEEVVSPQIVALEERLQNLQDTLNRLERMKTFEPPVEKATVIKKPKQQKEPALILSALKHKRKIKHRPHKAQFIPGYFVIRFNYYADYQQGIYTKRDVVYLKEYIKTPEQLRVWVRDSYHQFRKERPNATYHNGVFGRLSIQDDSDGNTRIANRSAYKLIIRYQDLIVAKGAHCKIEDPKSKLALLSEFKGYL